MKTTMVSLVCGLALAAGCGESKENQPATPPTPESEPATEVPAEEPAAETEAPAQVAVADLEARSDSKVDGTVTFRQTEAGMVEVTAEITGLKPGEHGFHIHETGDCSAPDAKSAGGHFAPEGNPHGSPVGSGAHHAGDFGNITAGEDGTAQGSWTVDYISFEGDRSIIGKAVVVHAKPDDLKSQPSGAAGARIACGVIEAQAEAAGEPAAGETAAPAEAPAAGETGAAGAE